jgi:hypothetical protein
MICSTSHALQKRSKLENRIADYLIILFLNFHPKLLKNSMTVISSCWQHFLRMDLSSSLDRIDQDLIQYVALKITCKGELVVEFLKITSF